MAAALTTQLNPRSQKWERITIYTKTSATVAGAAIQANILAKAARDGRLPYVDNRHKELSDWVFLVATLHKNP